MKKFLALSLLVFLLVLGCSKKDPIIGTWEGESNDGIKTTFIFKSDGKMTFKNEYGMEEDGTYVINGEEIEIKHSYWEKTYKFTITDNKLTLDKINDYDPTYKDLTKK